MSYGEGVTTALATQTMNQSKTEQELLRRLKNGDRQAFDLIYERWAGYVYNFTCKILFNKSLA